MVDPQEVFLLMEFVASPAEQEHGGIHRTMGIAIGRENAEKWGVDADTFDPNVLFNSRKSPFAQDDYHGGWKIESFNYFVRPRVWTSEELAPIAVRNKIDRYRDVTPSEIGSLVGTKFGQELPERATRAYRIIHDSKEIPGHERHYIAREVAHRIGGYHRDEEHEKAKIAEAVGWLESAAREKG